MLIQLIGAAGYYQVSGCSLQPYHIPIPILTANITAIFNFCFHYGHTAIPVGNIYIDDISINTLSKSHRTLFLPECLFQGTSSVPSGTTDNLIYG